MATTWQREDDAERAVDKILDAAARAFAEIGVARTGMTEIARFAGCSRATLYRYFPRVHELHVAFMRRESRRIVARLERELARFTDPAERLTETILRAVAEVRRRPETAAWFTPAESGVTARMSRRSLVVEAMTSGWSGAGREPGAASDARARWIVRVIVSLLTMPGDDDEDERMLVTRFAVPPALASSTTGTRR